MSMRKDDVIKGDKWMSALTASSIPKYQNQMTTKLPDQRPRKNILNKTGNQPIVWNGPGLPPNSDGSPIVRYPPQMTIPPTRTPQDIAQMTHGQKGAFCIESQSGPLAQEEWFHGSWQE